MSQGSDKRIFFALWPTEKQRQQLLRDLEVVMPAVDGRHLVASNWHVTLVFIGNFSAARLAELLDSTASLQESSIERGFDRVDFWKKPRIACLRASEVPANLVRLVGSLNAVLETFGHQPEEGEYRPHLTLARKASAQSRVDLARPIHLCWRGFELVESVSTSSGVKYLPLKQGLRGDF